MSEVVGSVLGGIIAGKIISDATLKVENLDVPISQLKASLDIISAASSKIGNLDTPISQLKTSLDNISGKADTTNATLLEVKSLLENTITTGRLFMGRPDAAIPSGEAWFVSSGSEAAFKSLRVDGEMRVDGKLIAKSIGVNGVLVVNGIVELD